MADTSNKASTFSDSTFQATQALQGVESQKIAWAQIGIDKAKLKVAENTSKANALQAQAELEAQKQMAKEANETRLTEASMMQEGFDKKRAQEKEEAALDRSHDHEMAKIRRDLMIEGHKLDSQRGEREYNRKLSLLLRGEITEGELLEADYKQRSWLMERDLERAWQLEDQDFEGRARKLFNPLVRDMKNKIKAGEAINDLQTLLYHSTYADMGTRAFTEDSGFFIQTNVDQKWGPVRGGPRRDSDQKNYSRWDYFLAADFAAKNAHLMSGGFSDQGYDYQPEPSGAVFDADGVITSDLLIHKEADEAYQAQHSLGFNEDRPWWTPDGFVDAVSGRTFSQSTQLEPENSARSYFAKTLLDRMRNDDIRSNTGQSLVVHQSFSDAFDILMDQVAGRIDNEEARRAISQTLDGREAEFAVVLSDYGTALAEAAASTGEDLSRMDKEAIEELGGENAKLIAQQIGAASRLVAQASIHASNAGITTAEDAQKDLDAIGRLIDAKGPEAVAAVMEDPEFQDLFEENGRLYWMAEKWLPLVTDLRKFREDQAKYDEETARRSHQIEEESLEKFLSDRRRQLEELGGVSP